MKIKSWETKRLKLLIISFGSLLLGFLIYLFFNQQTPISFWIKGLLDISSLPNNSFTIVIRCFGADFLWSLSFTMIIQFILWLKKKHTFLLILCSILGAVYELMQCFGFSSGTADILDVIVYILGSIIAITIIQGGKLYEEK